MFDFFHNLNQFYGVIAQFCTIEANPTMSAGVGLHYTWAVSYTHLRAHET